MTARQTTRRRFLQAGLTACVGVVAGCAGRDGSDDQPSTDTGMGENIDAPAADYTVETVVDGLENPWGIAFLPDESGLLVTERAGRLQLVDCEGGTREAIRGTPAVYDSGQGGLLDVALHPSFPDEPWVYLTYSATDGSGRSATHLGRGRLDRESGRLDTFERLHVAEPFVESDGHYGSRAVFGPDGRLYVTTGDRQFKDFGPDHVAQDTTNELGATLRLAPDGSIPADNPFVDDDSGRDAIFTYGHRNAQGLTVHPETGMLWAAEHGERDGDELNILERGENYGWPVATYACEYGTSTPVGDRPDEREDTVAPVYYWECGSGGFPPSGMTFYDGDAFPAWQGDLFVGTLAGQYLGRFTVDGRTVREVEPVLAGRDWRIRAVTIAPETGHLYVAVDDGDAPLVRLVPA